MGRKKLVGTNTFTLEDDDNRDYHTFDLSTDSLLSIIFSLKKQNEELNSQIMALEAELEDTNEQFQQYVEAEQELHDAVTDLIKSRDPIEKLRVHLERGNMVDSISWHQIFNKVDDDVKKRFVEFCDKYNMFPSRSVRGDWEWTMFHDKDTERVLTTKDFIERGVISAPDECPLKQSQEERQEQSQSQEEALGYGFVSPSGEFVEGPWGSHGGIAYDIIKQHNWEDEFWEWNRATKQDGTDFIVTVKKYVLLHFPTGCGRAILSRNPANRLTKSQKEFLYDYLMKDGQDILANHIMQEE